MKQKENQQFLKATVRLLQPVQHEDPWLNRGRKQTVARPGSREQGAPSAIELGKAKHDSRGKISDVTVSER